MRLEFTCLRTRRRTNCGESGGPQKSPSHSKSKTVRRAKCGAAEATHVRRGRCGLARPPRGDDAKCADACEGDDGDCAAAACEGAAAFVEYDDERKAPQQLFACGFLPNCLTPDAYYTGAASSEAYI